MQDQIWRHLIQILSFRNDLINTLKPFFGQLIGNNNNNKEKYNINEENTFLFLNHYPAFNLKFYTNIKLLMKKYIQLLYQSKQLQREIHQNQAIMKKKWLKKKWLKKKWLKKK